MNLTCPYCSHEEEHEVIETRDGKLEYFDCSNCDKTFIGVVSISVTVKERKVDCLSNGKCGLTYTSYSSDVEGRCYKQRYCPHCGKKEEKVYI